MKYLSISIWLKVVGCGLLLFLAGAVSAQDPGHNFTDPVFDAQAVIPPAPTVSNLIDFEAVPVDYYTGQPNITIPLFSKKIHKSVAINLQLGYSSNGIKIDNRSGWVGTGWSLSGLGVISKTVHGLPDEQNNGNGVGLWESPQPETFSNQQKWKVNGEDGRRHDSQYDVYNAAYPGGSVEFIVKSDGSQNLYPVILNSSEQVQIIIDYSGLGAASYADEESCVNAGHLWFDERTIQNIDGEEEVKEAFCDDFEVTAISSFTIITPNGISYEFSEVEYTNAFPVTASSQQGDGSAGVLNASQTSSFYVTRSAWHLTAIYTDASKRVRLVSILYSTFSEAFTASISRTNNRIDRNRTNLSDDAFNVGYNIRNLKPERTVSAYSSIAITKKPSKIQFRDRTFLELKHDTAQIHPETNGVILRSLTHYYGASHPITHYVLRHETTTVNNRLWLVGVDQENADHTERRSHTFNYYKKENLPEFDGVSDIWGFIEQGDIEAIGTEADPIKTGLLSSITYPTGGKKTFRWEQHRFSYAGSERFDAFNSLRDNPRNYFLNSQRVFTEGIYRADGNTFVLYEEEKNFPIMINPKIRLLKLDSDSTGYEPLDEFNAIIRIENEAGEIVFNQRLDEFRTRDVIDGQQLGQGLHTVKIIYPSPDEVYIDFDLRIEYQQQRDFTQEPPEKWIYGGGPRIRRIVFEDEDQTERQWDFSYSEGAYSSGVIDGLFHNYKPFYTIKSRNIFLIGSFIEVRDVWYEVTSDNVNAKMTNGSYVGYQHVRVSEQGKGYKTYEFSSPRSHPSPGKDFVYPFHQERTVDKYRGELRKEIDYQKYNYLDTLITEFISLDSDGEGSGEIQNGDDPTVSYDTAIVNVEEFFPKTSITYEYEYDVNSLEKSYLVTPSLQCEYFQLYANYSSDIEGRITTECPAADGGNPNCEFMIYPCTDETNDVSPFLTDEITHSNVWRQLKSKTTKQYEYTYDIRSQKTLSIIETYQYNDINRLVSSTTTISKENDQELRQRRDFYYSAGPLPGDVFTEEEVIAIQHNASVNRINDLVFMQESEAYSLAESTGEAEDIKGQRKVTYQLENDGYYELSNAFSRKSLTDVFIKDVEILRTDSYGNVLEYVTRDGIHNVHLYGHSGSLLVAKVQNATYEEVTEGISSQINNFYGSLENSIDTLIPQLRATFNKERAFLTTYHYDEQRRLKEIVDPNLLKITYFYNDFGQLTHVVDNDGNLLEENVYNYRN